MSSSLCLQCLLGIACKDFTMMAADQTQLQSIIVLKSDTQKLFELSDNIVMGVNGELGDIGQFTNFIKQNMALYRMRNLYELTARETIHFTRKNLCDAIAATTPYVVNILLGGYDAHKGGQLYSLDYLGSCMQVPFSGHGFGGMLCSSIFDIHYRPNLSEEAAYNVLVLCISEIQKRLFMNLPNFQVKVIDRNGVRDLPPITSPGVLSQAPF